MLGMFGEYFLNGNGWGLWGIEEWGFGVGEFLKFFEF